LAAEDDTTIVLDLSPQLSLPVNTPLDLEIQGDITADATLGTFRVRLRDGSRFLATDANTRKPIPAIYATQPIDGPTIAVESPVDSLFARGEAMFPTTIIVGETGVAALRTTLRHPGAPQTARIRCDELTLRCRDEARGPLAAETFLDRVVLLWNDAEVAAVSAFEAGTDRVGVPLPGFLMEPGETGVLTVVVDVEASAPASFLELSITPEDLVCVDANTGFVAELLAEDGAEFPLASGLTRLEAPARELVVSLQSDMPALLYANGEEITAGRLHLDNTADEGAGAITVESLTVHGADRHGTAVPVGAVAERVLLFAGETLLASSDSLSADSTTAIVEIAPALLISPESDAPIEIRLAMHENSAEETFRLGVTGPGIGVVQPSSALLTVEVNAAQGQSFPLWTEVGNFSSADLAESFVNYPNPFAAGREATRIAFNLEQNARVTLQVFTPVGQKVVTLLDQEPRDQGPQDVDEWDGRNGKGNVVRNGVYLVRLEVAYPDGRTEELLRKVAVAR
jgi:hypothetical protein